MSKLLRASTKLNTYYQSAKFDAGFCSEGNARKFTVSFSFCGNVLKIKCFPLSAGGRKTMGSHLKILLNYFATFSQ